MRKWIALLLTALMVLSLTPAFAVDSITAQDVAYIYIPVPVETPVQVKKKSTKKKAASVYVGTETKQEMPIEQNLKVSFTQSAAVTAELQQLISFTRNNAPAAYFPADIQSVIASLLPAGVTLDSLQLNELSALSVTGFGGTSDFVMVPFSFDTVYSAFQRLFPVVGLYDAQGNVTWTMAESAELEDGLVNITFSNQLLFRMQNAADVALALLNTP